MAYHNRSITIPESVIRRAAEGPFEGTAIEFWVIVDWPELELTDQEKAANFAAWVNGQPKPYPEKQMFPVIIPYVPRET